MCFRRSSQQKPVGLSAINTIISCKNKFPATKTQTEPTQVFCKRRSATLLLERGSGIAKFLSTLILENICVRLLLKISISLTNSEAVAQRSSVKKSVLRNFARLAVKHLCQSHLFNKVASLRVWHRPFPVNFVKYLRTPFFIEHLW